jgi:crotonobetainyl-CoA:carnitine CoA-transferase CaiB-like acyl-CoA transferase
VTFLPLGGIRVVDVTTSLAGPYCTELLAALGADVVKIEPPAGGDEARTWGPPFHDGEGTLFLAMNAGKRSLALDLRRGHEVLLRLAERADVFVQSLRPGLAEERGLGPNDLRALNPRLIYCSINAFGRTGPWSKRPGYDPLMQAAGGVISVTGEPGRPGVRVGVSLIDQGTGTWAALGIVAALAERERTGEGAVVDVALFETAIAYLGYHLTGYLASGTVPRAHGTAFPSIAPYETFATADGELMVAAGNDRLFASLAETVGLPELAADARFATNPDRVANREELVKALGERFRTAERAAWLERLAAAGVPAAPVQDTAEVAAHEQTQATGMLQRLGDLTTVALPLSFDGERMRHHSPPPRLGAHSAEVLAEAGYSEAEIEELAATGIVRLG